MEIKTSTVVQQAPNAEEQTVLSESDKRIINNGGCLYPNPKKDLFDPTGGKAFGVVGSGEVVKASDNATTSKDAKAMENQILLGRAPETTCGGMLKPGIVILDKSAPQRVGVIPPNYTLIPKKPVEEPNYQPKITIDKTTVLSDSDRLIIERGGCLYPRPKNDLNPLAPQEPVVKTPEPKTVIATDKSTGLSDGDRRIIERGGCLLPVTPRLDLTLPKENSGQKTSTVGSSDVAVEGNSGAGLATVLAAIPLAATDPFHSVKILENPNMWQQVIEQRLRELADFGRRVSRWNGQRMLNGWQNFIGHGEQIANKLAQAENELQQLLRTGKGDARTIDQLRRLVRMYGASLERVTNMVLRQTGLLTAEELMAIRGASRVGRAAVNAGRSAEEAIQSYRAARAAGIAAGEAELAAGAAAAEAAAAGATKLRIILRGIGGFLLWTAATEAAIWGSEAMKEAAKIELDASERMYAQSVINEALQDKIVQPFEIEQMTYAEALFYIKGIRQAIVEFEIQEKNAAQNAETPEKEEKEIGENEKR